MKFHKETFEVIFFARGGQGAKSAAEILAQAAAREGKFVQAFSHYGPERSGAPTKTFIRISEKPIRNHEPVLDPDAVLVLDETLLANPEIIKNLDRDEALIVNSRKGAVELAGILSKFKGKIYPIDATGISLRTSGQPRSNTVMLGKFVQVTEKVKLENVIAEFRKLFEAKLGKETVEKDILAIESGYDSL